VESSCDCGNEPSGSKLSIVFMSMHLASSACQMFYVDYSCAVRNSCPGSDSQQQLIQVHNELMNLHLSRSALALDGAGVIFLHVIPQSVISGSLAITHGSARPQPADTLHRKGVSRNNYEYAE
jgi:hypothetical protein